MFAAPPETTAGVFARVPDRLRIAGAHEGSRWARRGAPPSECFLEGPCFDRSGNLYLVDIAHGRVLRLSRDGQWSVVIAYDGLPNGLKIHKDGTIFVADHAHGILCLDPELRRSEVRCSSFGGQPLLGPNDLTFASNGDLFFTDQGASDLADPCGRVMRLRADGTLELLLAGIPGPNGLVLTPDERSLLVAVTRANAIWRIPLRADGMIGKVSNFIQLSGSAGGGPDGLAMDLDGNLSVAHAHMGTVWVFDSFGEPIRRIRSGAGRLTTNLAYGGSDRRTLYITESATGSILTIDMDVAGTPMFSHAR